MKRQKLKSLTKYILLGYFMYIAITSVVMFALPPQASVLEAAHPTSKMIESTERVVLIAERTEALKVRFDLMDQAEDTLDISYYSMQGGDSVDLFYAHILKAADRGVKVRFVIDGIAHNMRLGNRDVVLLFNQHPNIDLAFYESFDPLRPWTWHNRLHDKLMIVDQSIALIGGRNIGDKYFANEGYVGASNDFDLLLISEHLDETQIIGQMQTYFNDLWDHDYSVLQKNQELSSSKKLKAKQARERLMETYQDNVDTYPNFYTEKVDWLARSHEINQGYFVHNPVERFTKDPIVWREMLDLVSNAKSDVVIQSPYIIPSRQMQKDIARRDFEFSRFILLTNGMASSPNVIAHSGYRNYRNQLANSTLDLYEYQDPDQSLHMKSIVIDEQIAAVGSFNFDSRSMELNTESMVILDSPSLANEILETIEQKYLPCSILVDHAEGTDELLENVSIVKQVVVFILRPLTRMLDFLL